MKKISYIFLIAVSMMMTSCCEEFWQGMAMGGATFLGGMASSYNASSSMSSAFGWNAFDMPSYTPSVDWNSGAAYAGTTSYDSSASTSTSTTSSSSQKGTTTSTRHTCPLCNGTGSIIRDYHVATYGLDSKKYCDICKTSYMASTGHSHITCTQCHGKGYF